MSFASSYRSIVRKSVAWRAAQPRTETGLTVLRAYGFAVAVVAGVVALKHAARSPLGNDAPFLLMLGSTALVTWYAGRWAGVIAAVLGTLAVNYFFLPPYDDWHSTPEAQVQTALYGVENLLVCGLTAMLVSARRRAEVATARTQSLYALSSALVKTRTIEDVARAIVREGAAALGASSSGVFVCAEDGAALRLVAAHTFDPLLAERMREIPLDASSPLTAALKNNELLCVAGADALRARFPDFWALPRAGPASRAVACAPIRLDGRTLGVVGFAFTNARELSPDDRTLVLVLARDCARAIDRAQLFEAEQLARLQADQANRAKDEFLSLVSHELRTPLTAIAGWVHLLRRSCSTDRARLEHGLDVIERNVKTQARLVEDVLDMSRIISRRLKVERRPLDLAATARAVVDELAPAAAARGVELSFQVSGQTLVAGDAERLRQVTRNLVGNALKFTPRGGHVRVHVAPTDGGARLEVHDDGRGIAAQDLPFVFEMFRQVDASTTRREGGLGLGLAIVRHLVAAHGGVARVESEGPDQGTTAIVDLPRLAPLRVEDCPLDPPAIPTLAGVHVLVVEDDADTLEALSATLYEAGADVRAARSAEGALEVLAQFMPDVLVSDVAMPGQDGYWLIRKLRSMGALTARLPAIALTACSSAQDAADARAAGFQRHLTKPAEPEMLASTVAELARTAA